MGDLLRKAFPTAVRLGLDEATFAAVVVSLFMQIVGLLQMPRFIGPEFSPFSVLMQYPSSTISSSSGSLAKQESVNGNRRNAQLKMKNKQKDS